jgi:xylan 1,4-beta-xylosidase
MEVRYEQEALSNNQRISLHRYKNLKNLPHWHKEHEIIYVISGEATLSLNGNEYILDGSFGAFIKSEDIHSIKCSSDAVVEVMKVHCDLIKSITDRYSLITPTVSSDRLTDYFSFVRNEINTDEFSDIAKESAAVSMAVSIFRNEAKSEAVEARSPFEEKFKNLLDYLNVNYGEASFDSASGKMNISRPYFSKIFCERMGMTFTRYLNLIKVSAAVNFIRERDMKMTEIAYKCGFGTIRSFNRVFKEMTGYSPKDLPADYVPEYMRKYTSDVGCDPTLSTTEIIF